MIIHKKLVAISSAIFLTLPLATMAITNWNPPAEANINIQTLINTILNIVWSVFLGVAIIMFIIAGLNFITAQGEASKINTARQFVVWGAIGVGVALLSFSMTLIIRSSIGV